MKVSKYLVAFVLLSGASFAQAKVSVEKLHEKYQNESSAIMQEYAASTGKPAPLIRDYAYGMKIDVAKLVHTTEDISTCGNFKKIMSYEDSQGALHSVRYTMPGQCVNQR